MKRMILTVAAFLSLSVGTFCAPLAEADKLFRERNYAEAYAAYTNILFGATHSAASDAAAALASGVSCLNNLSRFDEAEALVESCWTARTDFTVRLACVKKHRGLVREGTMQKGKFVRGKVWDISARDRDRVRELQMLVDLMPSAPGQSDALQKDYWTCLAEVLLADARGGCRSVLLLNLTDIGRLPDYETRRSCGLRGGAWAPVDGWGRPVYHALPESWGAAKTDGERWRYAVGRLGEPGGSRERADFAAGQFSVFRLAEEAAGEPLIAELRTLGDDETLTLLQDGVRRLKLPADYNFLSIWRANGNWQELGVEYVRRYQFDRALAVFSNDVRRCQGLIDTIVQPRLGLDVSGELPVSGRRGSFDLLHRNATSATLSICRVDRGKMLDAVKKVVSDGEKHEDWRDYEWNLYNFTDDRGKRVREEFLVGPTNTWSVPLVPKPEYGESRERVEVPFDLRSGDYLLTARTGESAEALAFLHVSGLVAVQVRPVPFGNGRSESLAYRVVDARTGKPQAGVRAEVFAWRGDRPAKTNVVFEAKGTSDAEGLIGIPMSTGDRYYRGFVKLTAPDGTMTVVNMDSPYWWKDDEETRARCLFVTDRPVYRPGDTVRFKAWIQQNRYRENAVLHFPSSIKVGFYAPDGESKPLGVKLVATDAFGGASGEFEIPQDAKLGVYRLTSGHSFLPGDGTLRVEEYRKPEFEVTVDVPTNAPALGEVVRIPVRAAYYFGEPVRKGTVKVAVGRRSTKDDWVRPSPWRWLYGGWSRPALFEPLYERTTTLDDQGTAWVSIDTAPARRFGASDDCEYEIVAKVTDESRRMVLGFGRITVRAEPFRVHVWADRPRYHVGDVVRARMEVDGLADDRIAARRWRIVSFTTGATNEVATTFAASRAGQYRLVCEVESKEGIVRTGECVITVFGTDDDARNYRFNPLELATDKEFHAPGETATILISTDAPDSTVFVSVRNERERVVPVRGKTASLQVPVTAADYPNFSVTAWTVADGRFHQARLSVKVPPVRKVGRAEVEIHGGAAGAFKPGETVSATVRVFDSEGKPCDASGVMSVYDRAVDAVAGGSNVPDMRKFFWGWTRAFSDVARLRSASLSSLTCFFRFGHGLGLWGSPMWRYFGPSSANRREVVSGRARFVGGISKMGRTLSAAAVASKPVSDEGGRSAAQSEGVRRDFADTAYWNAALERTGTQGVYRVQFRMPEDVTGWNVKVWTMGAGGRVAEVATEIVTRKDLMLRLQTPRFLTARDAATLSANVHNYGATARTVKVSLRTEGVSVKGDCATQEIELAPGEERRVDWRIAVDEPGELAVTVAAADGAASDGVVRKLAVVPHRIEKTESFSRVIGSAARDGFAAPGEYTGAAGLELFRKLGFALPDGVKAADLQAVVEVSDTLSDAIVRSLPYLRHYEYECTEQTMNRFVPAVVARTALAGRDIGMAKKDIDDLVKRGLDKLREMQLSSGGWGWFYGNYEQPSVHLTATVLRGLLIARQNGVEIPQEMLARGLAWLGARQSKALNEMMIKATFPMPSADDVFTAFVLQLAGDDAKRFAAGTETMLKLAYGTRGNLPFYSLAQLGLAFDLRGETERRDMVVRNLKQFLRTDDENQTCHFELGNRSYWWRWYGSDVEAQATALLLLVRAEPQSAVTRGLARYLHNNRPNRTHWTSTRDTGLAIEAISAYCTAVERTDAANGPLYVAAYLTYPSEAEPITRAGLEIRIDRTVTRNGAALSDGDTVRSGDILDVRLDIDAKNDYEYILIEDSKGAGFEPLGTLSGYRWFPGFGFAYVEFRERKVALFLRNLPRGTKSLVYRVRAEVPGVYHVLPTRAEAMYAPRLRANSDEIRLKVAD